MKKINYLLILVISTTLIGCSIFQGGSDDKFEGYIKYSVDYEGDIDESRKAQMPSTVKEYYKGMKSRKNQESGMVSIAQISDYEKKQITVLMDMMGQKIAFKQNEEDINEAMNEMGEISIKETTETKEILGYQTKKYEVSVDGDVYTAYATNEIKTNANPHWASQFKDVKGVLLQYSTKNQGMLMTYTAEEVVEEKVDDDKFTIPEDYELKSADELKSMFGG